MQLPRYDRLETYRWNYDHAPVELPVVDVPPVAGSWTFCGRPVRSPLGIAAGPLLNGRWLLYYAALGFDVLTYKTTRSQARECYPLPNLQPVASGPMTGPAHGMPAADEMLGSWAVSFGMPSKAPEDWRADVAWTRSQLPREKLLSVSVVATPEPEWSLDDLADDFARCARWAIESGADAVETNFSCPNVSTRDGQLYQQPRSAGLVAQRVREAIGTRAVPDQDRLCPRGGARRGTGRRPRAVCRWAVDDQLHFGDGPWRARESRCLEANRGGSAATRSARRPWLRWPYSRS